VGNLNESFIKKKIQNRGLSQKDFADLIGITEQSLYKMFRTKSASPDTVNKIAKNLEVTVADLYSESGLVMEPAAPYGKRKLNVTYVPIQVQAGMLSGYDIDDAELTRFFMPGLPDGMFFMFDVIGDSMQPTIRSGDMVICEEVKKATDIRPKEAHVIFERTEGVVLKRLQEAGEYLQLISDNDFYPPYKVKKKDVKSIYRIRRVISADLSPKTYKTK
jgi:SOS-response transcriptional repressor LexA